MQNQFSRTQLLLGKKAIDKLNNSHVVVFGVGGVGGYAVEALARSGVGAIDVVDNDTFSITNINRQILATHQTIGKYKVDVAEERIKSINPNCVVTKYKMFYLPETASIFDFTKYDYIIDAIDTVAGKLDLVCRAKSCETPIICSMGAGNKLDATAFRVADIYKTKVCPLAKVMRTECRKRGIKSLKVVYSEEPPVKYFEQNFDNHDDYNDGSIPSAVSTECASRRPVPGSVAFVPSVVGLIIAGEVVKDLIGLSHR